MPRKSGAFLMYLFFFFICQNLLTALYPVNLMQFEVKVVQVFVNRFLTDEQFFEVLL